MNDRDDVAIATHALTKRYGPVTALQDVHLRVPAGAVYVLVGANGAGKSTTLRVLLNLERPSAGRAEIHGIDCGAAGAQARAQVGYVPETNDPGYAWMTCGQLLNYARAYRPSWDNAYAAQLVNAFGIRPDRRAGSLSKGEARRLQLLLALAHRPRVLVLDEPTDGLDPIMRNRTLTLLAEHLADSPTTVLLSTHQIHEVESLADSIGVLREGRLLAQMTRDEVRRNVRRYQVEVPQDWYPPRELQLAGARRSTAGRAAHWTLVGEEQEMVERLTLAGATVREVKTLSLEEAALALLTQEGIL